MYGGGKSGNGVSDEVSGVWDIGGVDDGEGHGDSAGG